MEIEKPHETFPVGRCRCILSPLMNEDDFVILKDVLEDDCMEDIPMNIRELEEKHKNEPTERLAEPDYYAGNGLSPLEAFKKGLLSREETIGFIKGNVIKYTVRAGKKDNASKDIVKAIDYLTHLKKLYESDDRSNQAKELVKQAFEDLNKIEEKQWHSNYTYGASALVHV